MRCIAVAVFGILPFFVSSYYVKIGILSDDPDADKIKKIWSVAQNYSTMMSLDPTVQTAQWWSVLDSPVLGRSVCSLVGKGIDALVFLGAPRWNSFVASYSTQLGLPLITALDHNEDMGKYQVNMMPDTSEAVVDFMKHFNWNKFVFIYDSDNGPNQLQKLLRLAFSNGFAPQIEIFWKTSDAEQAFHYIQESLPPRINRRIILGTSEAFADQLVAKLAISRNYNVLLLTPVGTVQRVSNKGFYKLIKLSVVDAQDPLLKTLENRLKTIPSFSARGRKKKDIPDSTILHYDSSSFLNTMFNKLVRDMPEALKPQKHLDCLTFNTDVPGTVDYLKKVYVDHGATGKIKFDEMGLRKEYRINIMQTTPFDVQKIGVWSDSLGLEIDPEFSRDTSAPTYEAQKMSIPLRVASILNQPFLYRAEDGTFSGYVIDLMDALCDELKRNCQLSLSVDGKYGTMNPDGTWNGMIGMLVHGSADLVIADLTKTLLRAKVMDFSKNIMTVGLNMLIKKPKSEMDDSSFGPFTFISVWSIGTWMVILISIVIYSAIGYAISRFIGVPDRVRALESKNTDNLSPCGSVWFTIGSLFCRDTGIYPRNITHRLWTSLWWIFCIFICLLYVAMLTSALIKSRTTITTTHSRKTSQELLKDLMDNGSPDIGVVSSGSTMYFFEHSEIGIYRQFGHYLRENPSVKAVSSMEGMKRVRASNGKYAFITESVTTQFIADSPPCDTLATSGFLNTRSYAVGLQKNSTLKEAVDNAILNLMETGVLRQLYEKWWHNISTSCEDPNLDLLPKVYNRSLTLHEASGLFYLLIGLIFLSMIVAVIENYIRTRNLRMES